MFDKSADLYDLIYDTFKDYQVESARVRDLIREHVPEARTLLDVACGTGRHLEHLGRDYECAGLDIDSNMLEIARSRNPDMHLVKGDMTGFDLARRFDVVICLFSAIGYAVTREKLGSALRCMASHLQPGGLLLVEPWHFPEVFQPGHVGAVFVDEPDIKVARISTTERTGITSVIEMHYYLIDREGTVTHLHERHELGLFSDEDYRSAFEAAGLTVDLDPEGLMGRGLYIGAIPP